MTVPAERTRAVILAGDFLTALSSPSGLKRIPAHVREMARSLKRHYPLCVDLGREGVWDEETAKRVATQLLDGELMPWWRSDTSSKPVAKPDKGRHK